MTQLMSICSIAIFAAGHTTKAASIRVKIFTWRDTNESWDLCRLHHQCIEDTHAVRNVLKQAVLDSAIKKSGDSLIIPRLLTFRRGDAEEQAWQADLRKNMHNADENAALIIEAVEWTPLPGYPKGDLSL